MRTVTRYPTARIPRSDRRFGVGPALAAAVHVVAVVAIVFGGRLTTEYARAAGGPGQGGGGGGGGRKIRYVELPPSPPAAIASRRSQQAPETEPVELVLPEPELEVTASVSRQFEMPLPTIEVVQLETVGPGMGTGGGPGSGSGSGGGIGTGRGSGVGAGTGPGGGEGGPVLAPEPRSILYPFEEAPADIKGRQFNIRFWVDARGQVTKVEVEPRIRDAAFLKKLLERMYQWMFYPARTLDGRPVAGQLVVTYQP